MRQALHGESLSSPHPAVPEFDPYRWLALGILRSALTPPVRKAGVQERYLARWAQSRVAWLKSRNGRFWVEVAGQSWEEVYVRTLAMCKRLQVQWRGPEPVASGVVFASNRAPGPEVREEPDVAKARKRRLILMLRDQGRTIEDISLTIGLSQRQVWRVIKAP